MASHRTKFAVGLFMACGIGIVILAIIWLGMSRFFQKGRYYAAYFDESVQGLDIDSPVKYRGVSIGRVEKILVAPDSKLIQVVLKIESGLKLDKNTVAQLKVVGITGSMFVELDLKKPGETDRSPPLNFPSEYPIIASRPSEISELIRGIDDVMNQIKSLDLEGISDRFKLALDSTNQLIQDANLKGISENFESSLDNISRVFNNQKWIHIIDSVEEASQSLKSGLYQMDGMVAENRQNVKTALEGFKLAMDNANIFLENGSSLLNVTDDSIARLRYYLIMTSQDLQQTTKNLNRLLELLSDHPSRLFFGEPPLPRRVEPEAFENQ